MTLDPEMFVVKEDNDLRLITPNHGAAVANAPWKRDTLHYRSRVETLYGGTVSQGYKKFFNLGSGPDGLRVEFEDVVAAASKGDAIATLKLDGSLLIRSEYRGQVMTRTRGSFSAWHLKNAYELLMFETKYPKVFKVGLYPNHSLLFEWTTPNNIIVLKYDQPELTLIGAVDHRDLSYVTIDGLIDIAAALEVPLVTWFPLTMKGWETLNSELDRRPDIEGYVIRLNKEQDLVKVKCAPYLTKHALKSSLDTEKLADMWLELGKPTFSTFMEHFKRSFDEETALWALGAISNLYDGVKVLDAIIDHMKRSAAARPKEFFPRKDVAIWGLSSYGQTKRFAAFMKLWEGEDVEPSLLKSILLQNTKQVEVDMFSKTESSPTTGE